ncbi:MAG: AAA family ATPase, partial [Proteobacteria bacterium]|nr:AAA family ATPase [Pseudomonadota bacterium]
MAKKLIPFGEISESFTGLRGDGIYYVDKTGFISLLIEQKRKITVATRPRRFGKTLMLKTLEAFFEYRVDDAGKPVDNRRYFEGLKVMDAGEDVLREMGQYPVIFISLKDVSGDTYQKVLEQLNEAVRQACRPHKSMFRAFEGLSDIEKNTLLSYQDGVPTE